MTHTSTAPALTPSSTHEINGPDSLCPEVPFAVNPRGRLLQSQRVESGVAGGHSTRPPDRDGDSCECQHAPATSELHLEDMQPAARTVQTQRVPKSDLAVDGVAPVRRVTPRGYDEARHTRLL